LKLDYLYHVKLQKRINSKYDPELLGESVIVACLIRANCFSSFFFH
jgi:hypothetical protein